MNMWQDSKVGQGFEEALVRKFGPGQVIFGEEMG